jgi:hypothetical protein
MAQRRPSRARACRGRGRGSRALAAAAAVVLLAAGCGDASAAAPATRPAEDSWFGTLFGAGRDVEEKAEAGVERPSVVNASVLLQMIADRRANGSRVVANFFSSSCPFSAEFEPVFEALPQVCAPRRCRGRAGAVPCRVRPGAGQVGPETGSECLQAVFAVTMPPCCPWAGVWRGRQLRCVRRATGSTAQHALPHRSLPNRALFQQRCVRHGGSAGTGLRASQTVKSLTPLRFCAQAVLWLGTTEARRRRSKTCCSRCAQRPVLPPRRERFIAACCWCVAAHPAPLCHFHDSGSTAAALAAGAPALPLPVSLLCEKPARAARDAGMPRDATTLMDRV